MHALVKARSAPGIDLQDIAKPVPGPNDVLIRVAEQPGGGDSWIKFILVWWLLLVSRAHLPASSLAATLPCGY
jgi:hypothetical protein